MTDIATPAPSTPKSRVKAKPETRSISVLLPVELADAIERTATERMIGRGLLVAKLIELGFAQLPGV